MNEEDVKVVISQKGTVPVYTRTKIGVVTVIQHDDTLTGQGSASSPLGLSQEILDKIDHLKAYTFSTGLTENDGVVTLNTATTTDLGGIIVGNNISVNNGEISVADASTGAKGVIEIATDEEASTGTSETLAVNPKQLATKMTGNSAITGATKCKITYDSKGLVTGGADLESGDIPDLSSTYQTKIDSNNKLSVDYVSGLATVATTGSYSDLTNTPVLGTMASESASDYTKTSGLATVATTGSYTDLSNKPTIPAAQVNSDWNANSGVAQILNKPTLGTMAAEAASDYTKTSGLATVATTGNYSDLTGKPTIPTVGDGIITITQGGVQKGTFTTNQSGNTTIDVDAGSSTLSGLTDVTISSATSGQVLTYDGSGWVNLAPATPSNMQTTTNLVTSVSSSSTDTQYPSAKLFYDTCGDIETLINAL